MTEPVIGRSFTGGPITVVGQSFAGGLATYPFSEVAYDLGKRGLLFRSQLGVTDDSDARAGSVRFFVYGDEFLLHESDTVRAGEKARAVDIDLRGLSELRLVVDDAGDGPRGDYAVWAESQLFTTTGVTAGARENDLIRSARAIQSVLERKVRKAEYEAIRARRAVDGPALERHGGSGPRAVAELDEESSELVLANSRVGTLVGYGGERNGRVTLLRRADDLPILLDVGPSLTLQDGRRLALADMSPARSEDLIVEWIVDPVYGRGVRASAAFLSAHDPGRILFVISLFDRDAVIKLAITATDLKVAAVEYLDLKAGSVFLGRSISYRTDGTGHRYGSVPADGHVRKLLLDADESAMVWSEATGQGLRISSSNVSSPVRLTAQRNPGQFGAALGLQTQFDATQRATGRAEATPSVVLQLTEGPRGGRASNQPGSRVTQ